VTEAVTDLVDAHVRSVNVGSREPNPAKDWATSRRRGWCWTRACCPTTTKEWRRERVERRNR
jgi:hypothetical protein